MKIIAAIDILGGNVVRLVKGDPANKVVYSNDPVAMAAKWEGLGAEMLHVVDLDATLGTGSNSPVIASMISTTKIQVQVAGGIRSIADSEAWMTKNAHKIVIGTMAFTDTDAVKKLAKKYPGRIVVSVDQKGGLVMIKGWTESAGVTVHDAIAKLRSIGVREFLLTSVERDGTLGGPDTTTLSDAAASGVQIIASGGISRIEDILKVKNAGCSSAILGKALYDGKINILNARTIS